MLKSTKFLTIFLFAFLLLACSTGVNQGPNAPEVVMENETTSNATVVNDGISAGEESVQEEPVAEAAFALVDEKVIEAIELELNQLINKIKSLKDSSDVIGVFKDFMITSELEIIHVYYADHKGLHIEPRSKLPEDYDPTLRPFYVHAIKEGVYIPAPYLDLLTNKMIQTLSKPIYVNSEVVGVIGMDVYLK